VEALKLAVAIRAKGYNVFVAGLSGTGKRTAVMRILKEQPFQPERVRDIVFVNNFLQPDRPRVLYFSPGDASRFRRRLQTLVDNLKEQLPNLMEKSGFRESRDRIMLDTEGREAEALREFEKKLSLEGFAIVQVQEDQEQRSDINPVIDGEPVSLEDLQQHVAAGTLTRNEWSTLRKRYYQLMDQMNQIFISLRGDRITAENKLNDLQRETIMPLLENLVGEIERDFNGDAIHLHLKELKDDVLENLDLFVPQDLNREPEIHQEMQRYAVNIVADHTNTRQTPVVFESHPDYQKLFGTQDSTPDPEGRHGFMGLRGGSLIAASGGYIIMRAEDVLGHEEIWGGIKRVLCFVADPEADMRLLAGRRRQKRPVGFRPFGNRRAEGLVKSPRDLPYGQDAAHPPWIGDHDPSEAQVEPNVESRQVNVGPAPLMSLQLPASTSSPRSETTSRRGAS